MNFSNWIDEELDSIKQKNRLRSLKPPVGLDVSSNDYLGLTQHPLLKEKLIEGIQLFGAGSGASRLIRGHREVYEEAEFEFARWVGGEAAVFLANGFSANLGLMDVLGSRPAKFYSDRLNHASILDGIRLSGSEVRYYKHRNYEDLENLLKKEPSKTPKVIVSESVFSMDGDLADISQLLELKRQYNAVLVLDEAHALGIFGMRGGGLSLSSSEIDVSKIDFRVFTCGKSLGLEGAFIVCSKKAKQYLINTLRTFIFSTAPLPAIAYASRTAMELVQSMEVERGKILRGAEFLRKELAEMKIDTLESESQIVPVLTGDEAKTMQIAETLQANGLDVRGIRPPTVKKSRLRISINSQLTEEDLSRVVQIIKESL